MTDKSAAGKNVDHVVLTFKNHQTNVHYLGASYRESAVFLYSNLILQSFSASALPFTFISKVCFYALCFVPQFTDLPDTSTSASTELPALAREVFKTPKFSHANPLLKSLHRLKTNERVE